MNKVYTVIPEPLGTMINTSDDTKEIKRRPRPNKHNLMLHINFLPTD
ncbi:18514_t:CDS:1, partial [Rhizophagus irregularis]